MDNEPTNETMREHLDKWIEELKAGLPSSLHCATKKNIQSFNTFVLRPLGYEVETYYKLKVNDLRRETRKAVELFIMNKTIDLERYKNTEDYRRILIYTCNEIIEIKNYLSII